MALFPLNLLGYVPQPLKKVFGQWAAARYLPRQSPLAGVPADRRPYVVRLVRHNLQYVFGVDGAIALLLVGLGIELVQIRDIHAFVTAPAPSHAEPLYFVSIGARDPEPYPLQRLPPIFIVLAAILAARALIARAGSRARWLSVAAACVLVAAIDVSYPVATYAFAYTSPELAAANANRAVSLGRWDQAQNMLAATLATTRTVEQQTKALLALAPLEYALQDYATAGRDACRYVDDVGRTGTDPDRDMVAYVRGSLYHVAHLKGDAAASALLDEFRGTCGTGLQSDLSIFWTAIHPAIARAIALDPFQHSGPWWGSMSDGPYSLPADNLRTEREVPLNAPADYYKAREQRELETDKAQFEMDLVKLDTLVNAHPNEPLTDTALFVAGRYLDIIVSRASSPLLADAYYAWAMDAFRQKNYRESIRRFTAFLTKYRKHPYRDDALWRIANAYSAMHQPTETLTYLLAALEEPNADGEVWGVCLECDIFHTLELSTPADLETFARSSTSRQGARAAYFSLGMSQLADGALKDALVYFLTACLGTREAPQSERLTAEVGFACQAKVQILQKLADFDGQPSPDGDIARAEFLIANPDALVNSRGQFTQLADDQIPLDYYLARNANLRAGMLLENVLGQEPPGPRRIRLIKEAADAFDTAASGAALTDKATIEMLRDKAVHWYAELLSSTPSDSPDFELAFEAIPAVYMHRPKLGGSWLQVFTADEVRAIQSHYADLAARYPESPLADNALNWVAWGYCYLANLSPSDSAEYETNYASALEVYKHLAADYPMSSPAMNARENIPVIEGKLADRGKRVAVPEERWTWPLGQFPGLLQPGRP